MSRLPPFFSGLLCGGILTRFLPAHPREPGLQLRQITGLTDRKRTRGFGAPVSRTGGHSRQKSLRPSLLCGSREVFALRGVMLTDARNLPIQPIHRRNPPMSCRPLKFRVAGG